MKRKLSLLMALMMVIALLPMSSFAATANRVDRVVSVTSSGSTEGNSPSLIIDNDKGDLRTAQTFRLELGNNAKWNETDYPRNSVSTTNSGSTTVRRVSDSRLEVTVVNTATQVLRFPLSVDFSGASEGAQKVTVVPVNSGVTAGEYTFATVGAGDVMLSADRKVKISRTGNQTVSLMLDEVAVDSFENGNSYTLRLPRNFYWANATVTAGPGTRSIQGTDNRELIITVSGESDSRIESIFITADIVPTRDARFGDVEVSVVRGKLSPSNLVVAEYVDFAAMVSVDEVVEVISGRDEADLYVATLIIEEPVEGTLVQGRYIEVTMDRNVASLQNGGEIVVDNKDDVVLWVDQGSSRAITGSGFDTRSTIDTRGGDFESYKFDLLVNQSSVGRNASTTEIEIPFVVDTRHEGDVEITVKGAGIEEQTIVIAKAKKPAKIEVAGNALAELKLGVQSQDAPEIIITETEAGSIIEGDYSITTNSQYQINWAGAKFEVIEGDIEIDEDSFGIRAKSSETGTRDGIKFTVDGISSKASKIRIYDIKITLDRTVPYGQFSADFNFGTVGTNHKDLVNRVERLPYFQVITPVQDGQRMTAVFTIGDANYTVNGEAMTLDAAPFISNNRTMLPIGTIAQVVGASVNYSPVTRTAIFTKDGVVVSMTLDQPFLTANGVVIPMDSAPVVVNSRAFVPMAFVAQAFGVPVQYDAAARTVTVN